MRHRRAAVGGDRHPRHRHHQASRFRARRLSRRAFRHHLPDLQLASLRHRHRQCAAAAELCEKPPQACDRQRNGRGGSRASADAARPRAAPCARTLRSQPERRPAAARCGRAGPHRRARADRGRRADLRPRPQSPGGVPRPLVHRGGGGGCDADHGQPRREPRASLRRGDAARRDRRLQPRERAMIVLRLALQSLRNRWLTAVLTVFAIAVSIMLLLGVEKVRVGARQSFADTISGTDLIVGARSGSIQLLLYAVFRIGNATNNITWASLQDIASRPEVAWVVPLSLGDSHRGFRVLGTTPDYFKHYRYRQSQGLTFRSGGPFADLFDAVIGADVAQALGYKVGDPIIVSHGLGAVSFVEHDDKPFRVAGILEKTGTPVDRTVHVSLEAIEAIHVDWQSGARIPGQSATAAEVREMDLTPKAVTAALVGLKSRLAAFRVQRAINEYPQEPLSAILPGAALQELWGLVGTAETALQAVSAMVVATALLGMVTMILTTLNERRREMAILRS